MKQKKEGNGLEKFKLYYEELPKRGYRKVRQESILGDYILSGLYFCVSSVLRPLKAIVKVISQAVDDIIKW